MTDDFPNTNSGTIGRAPVLGANQVVHVFKTDDGPFSPQDAVFLENGRLGIKCKGVCIVMLPQEWHAMAAAMLSKHEPLTSVEIIRADRDEWDKKYTNKD